MALVQLLPTPILAESTTAPGADIAADKLNDTLTRGYRQPFRALGTIKDQAGNTLNGVNIQFSIVKPKYGNAERESSDRLANGTYDFSAMGALLQYSDSPSQAISRSSLIYG